MNIHSDKQKGILVPIDLLHMKNTIIKTMLLKKEHFIANQDIIIFKGIRKFIRVRIFYFRGKMNIKFCLKKDVKITYLK